MAECSIASAGPRNCRPRHQRWACQPQPACCQPMGTAVVPNCCEQPNALGAKPLTATCACAVYSMAGFTGYAYYYGVICANQQPAGIAGAFTAPFGCPSPAPPCRTNNCIDWTTARFSGSKSGNHGHQVTAHLNRKLDHNEALTLFPNAGSPAPERNTKKTTELLRGNDRTLVRFDIGQTRFYAKLHLLQFEERAMPSQPWELRGQFAIGQEINEPPTGFSPTLLTTGVEKVGSNVVELQIGSLTYQVVTFTSVP